MGDMKIYDTANFLMSYFRPQVERFERKEELFRKEIQQNQIIALLEGEIFYCRENQSFERNILGYYRPGDFICPFMLVQPDENVNYFLARSKGKYFSLSMAQITGFMKDSEEWITRLLNDIYNAQFKRLLVHNEILQQKTIRKRLLTYLESLSRETGSRTVTVPFPYSDLADYLSTDRSAMMKELGKLTKEGLITEKKRVITLSDNAF